MSEDAGESEGHGDPTSRAARVRIPGFISEDEVGLGDLIRRTTYALGVQPCGGCEQRAAALNRWMMFRR